MLIFKKQWFPLLLLFLALPVMAQDKVYDKLVLTDVSVVEGRILIQHPGQDLVFLKGTDSITYSMNQILAIERVMRDPAENFGIDDIIVTNEKKEYRGQIIRQVLGRSVYIQVNDGPELVIDNEDIVLQKKAKCNADQTLYQQAPFLDVVKTKDEQYRGIIVLQDYGSDDSPSFLCIENANGKQHKVEIEDIVEMQRIPNDAYQVFAEQQ